MLLLATIQYMTKINSVPWSSQSEDTLFRISMQSTISLVSTFSQFDSIQSDLISVFPVTRPLRFVHRELGLGHYGEILTRTFRILHLQRLHAKAIYPTSTIYILLGFYFTYWSYKFCRCMIRLSIVRKKKTHQTSFFTY